MEKPAYRSTPELDQWTKEERSYRYLISCGFVTNGKSHCFMSEYHSYLQNFVEILLPTALAGKPFWGEKKKANNVCCQAAKSSHLETQHFDYTI